MSFFRKKNILDFFLWEVIPGNEKIILQNQVFLLSLNFISMVFWANPGNNFFNPKNPRAMPLRGRHQMCLRSNDRQRSGFFVFHFFDLKFFLGILQDNQIFFGDWTFLKGSLGRVMALQRPRLVLALKNRKKYPKTCKVGQNFSFF